MPFDQVLADAGYDSEANHRHCRGGLGADSLIPAKERRSARVLATTPLRQEMLRRLGARAGHDAAAPGDAAPARRSRRRGRPGRLPAAVEGGDRDVRGEAALR
jgi:hypothetical protein